MLLPGVEVAGRRIHVVKQGRRTLCRACVHHRWRSYVQAVLEVYGTGNLEPRAWALLFVVAYRPHRFCTAHDGEEQGQELASRCTKR